MAFCKREPFAKAKRSRCGAPLNARPKQPLLRPDHVPGSRPMKMLAPRLRFRFPCSRARRRLNHPCRHSRGPVMGVRPGAVAGAGQARGHFPIVRRQRRHPAGVHGLWAQPVVPAGVDRRGRPRPRPTPSSSRTRMLDSPSPCCIGWPTTSRRRTSPSPRARTPAPRSRAPRR